MTKPMKQMNQKTKETIGTGSVIIAISCLLIFWGLSGSNPSHANTSSLADSASPNLSGNADTLQEEDMLDSLLQEKEELEAQRASLSDSDDEEKANLDKKIADIDAQISNIENDLSATPDNGNAILVPYKARNYIGDFPLRKRRIPIVPDGEDNTDASDDTEIIQNISQDNILQDSDVEASIDDLPPFILPVHGPVTSSFGYRIHPISGVRKFHSGTDIAVDAGTPVHASNYGKVILARDYNGFGNCIILAHGNGAYTLYGHNSKLLVSEGDIVSQGQVIALAGSTGYSTGPHCHFSMWLNNELVDPMKYVD